MGEKDPRSERHESFSGLLRVVLDPSVPKEVLLALHQGEELDRASPEIARLFKSCGGEKASPVYRVSPEEVQEDKYGFARELKLYVVSGIEAGRAADMLCESPMVESCEVSGFQQLF